MKKKKGEFSTSLNLRIRPQDRRRIDEAARRAGKPISWWVRETLLAAAAKLAGRPRRAEGGGS